MTNERDQEKFGQQDSTDKAGQPIGQESQAGQAPISQGQDSQSGQSSQSPTGELGKDGSTITEQKSDIASEQTGEGQPGGFVGKQGEDSGDYLREQEAAKTDSDSKSESSKDFGTNGE